MKKYLVLIVVILLPVLLLLGGYYEANVASENLSTAADNFEITRRIVFYNGVTGDYILTIEGLCSINADTLDGQLELTCKVGANEYKKHFLGLSDNVTYFAEQIEPSPASVYHYRVIFRPSVIVPDIEID